MTATHLNEQTLSNGLVRITIDSDFETIGDIMPTRGAGAAGRIVNAELSFGAATDIEYTIGAATEARKFSSVGGAAMVVLGEEDDLVSGQNEAIRMKTSVSTTCKGHIDVNVGPNP